MGWLGTSWGTISIGGLSTMVLDMVEDVATCHVGVWRGQHVWIAQLLLKARKNDKLVFTKFYCCWQLHCRMVTSGNNMSQRETQHLEQKRRYEVHSAIRRRNKQAHAVREHDYINTFIKEYESLDWTQGAMRRRTDQIWIEGLVESRRKQIYDAIYRIEAEKNRWPYTELVDYKCYIEHVRLGIQASMRSSVGEIGKGSLAQIAG